MVWSSGDDITSNHLNYRDGTVFNVRDSSYGAVGDGSADDTSAIQSAIEDALEARGSVFLPEGTYAITSLDIVGAGSNTSGCQIFGAGTYASTLSKTNSDGSHAIRIGSFSGNSALNTPAVHGLRLRDFSVVGPGGTFGENGDGIYVNTVQEGASSIENVRVTGFDWGISLRQTFPMKLDSVRVHSNARGVRAVATGVGGETNQVTMINPWVKSNNGTGLDIPCGKWTVIGGAIENPGTSAATTTNNIQVRGTAYSCQFTGVYSESADQYNIAVLGTNDGESSSPRDTSFLGCYFNNVTDGDALAFVGDADNVLFDSCFFDGSDVPLKISADAGRVWVKHMYNDTSSSISNLGSYTEIETGDIFIPASMLVPSEQSGGHPSIVSNDPGDGADFPLLRFYSETTTSVSGLAQIPDIWTTNLAGLRMSFYNQAATAGSSGTIVYQLDAAAIGGGASLGAATAVTSVVSFGRDASAQQERRFGDLITPSNLSNQFIRFHIQRNTSDANDTYANYDRLVGVRLSRVF